MIRFFPAMQSQSRISRLLFIDTFRGFCVLAMIEAHVSNALVRPEIRKTVAFHYLDLFHGSISASFIFIAGFAFALALEKKWDDFLHFRKPLFLQTRRLLFILALGYWLHLPDWSFQSLLAMPQERLLWTLRADVLMLISVTLLMTLVLTLFVRNKKTLPLLYFVFGLGIVFSTPFVFDVDPLNYLPGPLATYLTTKYGSIFPIFHWSGYSFLGSFLCHVFLHYRHRGKEKQFFKAMLVGGLLLTATAFALFYLPWQYAQYESMSAESPRSFQLKLGLVLSYLSIIWFLENRRKPESKPYLNRVGQESLFVYAFHLMIVYGSVFTPHHMAWDIGPKLNYVPAFGISLLLILVMVILALLWNKVKEKYPQWASRFFYLAALIYLARFFSS